MTSWGPPFFQAPGVSRFLKILWNYPGWRQILQPEYTPSCMSLATFPPTMTLCVQVSPGTSLDLFNLYVPVEWTFHDHSSHHHGFIKHFIYLIVPAEAFLNVSSSPDHLIYLAVHCLSHWLDSQSFEDKTSSSPQGHEQCLGQETWSVSSCWMYMCFEKILWPKQVWVILYTENL